MIFCNISIYSQASYKGTIGNYPITFATHYFSTTATRAVYCYDKFDEPIVLKGKLDKGNLTLFEHDSLGQKNAVLIFPQFKEGSASINGTWKNLKTKKEYPISLTKEFDLDDTDGEGTQFANKELIQEVAMKDAYFKVLISKEKESYYARVSGIKIIQKKTDKVLQEVETDCEVRGFESISIDDYNFDGYPDFSVFESFYAGPNTSSLYFLYDPTTKKFFNSGFSGTSLEFDPKSKTIHEHNQCCAGTSQTSATYKLVKNKMVLVEQHCFKLDEKRGELVERPISECE